MKLTNKQLASFLHVPVYTARRWAKMLSLAASKEFITFYHLPKGHPLRKSIEICQGSARPVYTITQISKLWSSRKGNYTARRVRQRLELLNVPVQNKNNLGLVYLIDLVPILQETITEWEISELY